LNPLFSSHSTSFTQLGAVYILSSVKQRIFLEIHYVYETKCSVIYLHQIDLLLNTNFSHVASDVWSISRDLLKIHPRTVLVDTFIIVRLWRSINCSIRKIQYIVNDLQPKTHLQICCLVKVWSKPIWILYLEEYGVLFTYFGWQILYNKVRFRPKFSQLRLVGDNTIIYIVNDFQPKTHLQICCLVIIWNKPIWILYIEEYGVLVT
jgi:hypothetical protein